MQEKRKKNCFEKRKPEKNKKKKKQLTFSHVEELWRKCPAMVESAGMDVRPDSETHGAHSKREHGWYYVV